MVNKQGTYFSLRIDSIKSFYKIYLHLSDIYMKWLPNSNSDKDV